MSSGLRTDIPAKNGSEEQDTSSKRQSKECTLFEPQTWRKNVCQNCFKMKSQHNASPLALRRHNKDSSLNTSGIEAAQTSAADPPNLSPRSIRKLGANVSPRTSRKSLERTPSGKSLERSPSASKRTTPEPKRKDYKDDARHSSKAYQYGEHNLSRSRSASKESLRSGAGSRSGNPDEKYIEELENDLFELEDKYDSLDSKRAALELEVGERVQQIEELQAEIDNYRVKVLSLEKKIIQLEGDVRTYRERLKLPESEQSEGAGDASHDQTEELYQELLEENDQLREEVDELQRELSEMHDSFMEDESANAAKELQRELDAANKSYRVLQFKLRKAERRFEQCEGERNELEEKFRRLGERLLSGDESAQIQELEDELRMAKGVSVQLHEELEFIEEKRVRLDNENHRLKIELETSERDRIRLENEIDRVKLELEKVKSDHGLSDAGPLQVVDKSSARPRLGVVVSRESSIEEEQLKRELGATKERETDLVEQLRYSKEEIKILKRKLEEAEEESDSLSAKLGKLAGGSVPGRIRFGSDDSEIDLDDVGNSLSQKEDLNEKIDKMEKEAAALKKKVVVLNKENQDLQADVNLLEGTVDEYKKVHGDVSSVTARTDSRESGKLSRQKLLEQIDADLNDLKKQVKDVSLITKDEKTMQDCWIETSESKKQLELRVDELRRQIYELENENGKIKIELENLDTSKSFPKGPSSIQDLDGASKADLIRELGKMEDVIEDMTISVKQGDFKNEQLEFRIKSLEQELSESRQSYEDEERFYIHQFEQLQKRNEILGDLLTVITARRKYMYESDDIEDGDVISRKPENDEVFTDKLPEEIQYWDSTFKERLRTLEELLKEERLRSRQYQKKLDFIRTAQKSEEKDYEKYMIIIEEKESQICDYKIRLEQSRKMYEALKILVDETENSPTSSAADRVAQRSDQINSDSNRAELSDLKKRSEQLSAKHAKMESEKATMEKNLHILNEELRLREEHIFEQDDMIRSLQRKLQEADREFERLKNELTQLKTQFTSVKEKNSESFKLREELQKSVANTAAKEKHISELKQKLNDQIAEGSGNVEKLKTLQDCVRSRDDRIKEKDELISLINTRLANREREINDLDNMLKQTNAKLTTTEEEMVSVRAVMTEQEKEVRGLRVKITELQESSAKQSTELFEVRKKHDNLNTLFEKFKTENQRQLSEVMKERDDIKQMLECKQDGSKFTFLSLPDKCDSGFSSISSPAMLLDKYGDSTMANVPIEIQVRLKHLEQVEKIYLQLTHQQITLKLQVEAYQREVEEFRELYYTLKDKHRRDSETWMFEKENFLKLCTKHDRMQQKDVHELKEELVQKDKKIMQMESDMYRMRQDHANQTSKLEKEKLELHVKAGGFAEEKKIPKVLQRFAGSKRTPLATGDAGAFEGERKEYQVRLQEQEKKIERLRKELCELDEKQTSQELETLQRYAKENVELTKKVEEMRFDSEQVNENKQECIRLHDRFRSMEEQLLKERRRWQNEKTSLQYTGEQYRVMLDQWLDRFLNAVDEMESGHLDKTKEKSVVLDEVKTVLKMLVEEINCYKLKSSNRERSPTRSRLRSNYGSTSEEPPAAATPETPRYQAKPPTILKSGPAPTTSLGSRSISMDWSKSFFRSESPFRSKRAASPDVSIKKVTNFPDPSPGFWIKPSSRTNSRESLTSSQTNLSTGGNFSSVKFGTQISWSGESGSNSHLNQSKVSGANAEARKKFYQSYDEKVYSSNDKLALRLSSVDEEMTRSVHLDAATQGATGFLSKQDKRDIFAKKSHSIEASETQETAAKLSDPKEAPSTTSKLKPEDSKPPTTKPKKNPFGVTLKSVKSDKAASESASTSKNLSSRVSSIHKLFQSK